MQLSDSQIWKLRNAIRFFWEDGKRQHGGSFNLKDVVEAIDLYTGIRVPYERLRVFVMGAKDSAGERKYSVPEPERLKAIFDFVTHPELGLLTPEELEDRQLDKQAALRLLAYLDQDFDGERIMPPESVSGIFRRSFVDENQYIVSELHLERPNDDGLVNVKQTDLFYDGSLADKVSLMPLKEEQKARSATIHYAGWAILTPEDNLIFFLKNARNGRNRYYFTMASDLSHDEEKLSQLYLLDHDYPVEMRDTNESDTSLLNGITKRLQKKVGVFHRQNVGAYN